MSNTVNECAVCPVSGQSAVEELVNSWTHGLGFVLSLAGLSVLVIFACWHGTLWHVVSFTVYGVTLVLLYGSSMLYHRAVNLNHKRRFQIIDHICIYLLIAGTYTPFMVITLRGGWGWSLLGIIWTLAGLGVVLELKFKNRTDLFNTLLYLAMSWLVVMASPSLWANLATGGLVLLIAGGIAYSLGTVFYLCEKIPFNHALWHLFVLAGSICHFFAILFFVLPVR
jgi:hemolysin III